MENNLVENVEVMDDVVEEVVKASKWNLKDLGIAGLAIVGAGTIIIGSVKVGSKIVKGEFKLPFGKKKAEDTTVNAEVVEETPEMYS